MWAAPSENVSTYANSEDPDKLAHQRRPIKVFVVRRQNHRILENVSMPGAEFENLRLCRMMS